MYKRNEDICKIYDQISDWFDKTRSRELFEESWLDKASSLLSPSASVLDLGCGMGEPIIPYFLKKGYNVTGVDGSKKLLTLAKMRYPEVEFIFSDIRNLKISKKFDLVIAWHSIFHLSREDQRSLFPIVTSCLKNGGVLLFTSGHENGEIWSDNGGENLYHASLDPHEYIAILRDCGFNIIEYQISDNECGGANVWLARLNKGNKDH